MYNFFNKVTTIFASEVYSLIVVQNIRINLVYIRNKKGVVYRFALVHG